MLGILCGLESEAKIARTISGTSVACAAARPHKARELAQELVAHGATRLMSFGIAGSLESSIHLGDLLIGTRVVSKTRQWMCDRAWGEDLLRKIPRAKHGGVYGSETLVATVGEKDALFRTTGCTFVDMESQCAAEIAAEAKIPFLVVRAICDDKNMNVPPLVMAAIAEDGGVDVFRALGHWIRSPAQTLDLFQVMRGTHTALKTLRAVRAYL